MYGHFQQSVLKCPTQSAKKDQSEMDLVKNKLQWLVSNTGILQTPSLEKHKIWQTDRYSIYIYT